MMRTNTIAVLLVVSLFLALSLAACAIPKECAGAPDKDLCIIALATERHDPSLCDTVTELRRAWCINDAALAALDESACDRLSGDGREFCRRDVIVAKNDVTGCASLAGTPRDSCYNSFAKSGGDWRLCREIVASSLKESCILEITAKLDDPEGCLSLDDTSANRDQCLFSRSIAAKNVETCLAIRDLTLRGFCIVNIAVAVKDSSLCERLPEESFQSSCAVIVEKELVRP